MDFLQLLTVNDKTLLWKTKEPGSGGHRSGSTSFEAIGATLVPVIITATAFLIAFVLLRTPFRNIYAPRTYFRTIPEKDRTPSSSRAAVSWFHDYRTLDEKFLLRHSSLDAYLFLRFLRMVVILCLFGCCLTWPILIPVNATGGGDAKQLDRIGIGNVQEPKRLYAHAIVAWLFLGFVVLLVTRERLFAINLGQAHATVKANAMKLSSRVVLFLSVPDDALKDENLESYFGPDAKRSWTVSKVDDLEQLVSDRSDNVSSLEVAQMQLETNAIKQSKRRQTDAEAQNGPAGANGSTAKTSKPDVRPKHRLNYGIGDKVDSIDHLRKSIVQDSDRAQSIRDAHLDSPDRETSALFVEFTDQAAAQQAYQRVHHRAPLSFQPRYIGVQPKEVLWSNLGINPALRITYSYLAIAFIVATIILWSIPIGIIGTISNIDYLTDKVHFLRFVNNLPDPILGFIKGFVPPFILSEVVSYVPNFFRWVAKKSGQPTTIEAEKMTQKWYFAFQVIQVFLVTTFSSGAATVATKIANSPTSIPELLAKNLPKASNFYLSYFVLQGIATSAKNLVNYSDVATYYLYDKYLDKTPRQKYTRYVSMKGMAWGKIYPKFTNFAVIGIAYACIAPLVLGFATVGLYLFYLSYKYQLLYVVQVKMETKGRSYTLALQHLMTGVYLSELCLIGYFGIHNAPGASILMVVLLIATVVYHYVVDKYLTPLERYMPLDILHEQEEDEPLLSREEGVDSERAAQSRIYKAAAGKIPTTILDPLASFLEPHIFATPDALRPWLQDPATDDDDLPKYSEDELKNAYVNPALTAKTPKIWLARDPNGVSKQEIEANESAGLPSTDEAADLDEKCEIVWNKDDFSHVPIFKVPKQY